MLEDYSEEKLEHMTYYEILSAEVSASKSEIQKLYRELAQKYHPDVASDDKSVLIFKLITRAYNTLSNEDKRTEYDRTNSILSPGQGNIFERTKKYMGKSEGQPLNPEFGSGEPVREFVKKSDNSEEKTSKLKNVFGSVLGKKSSKEDSKISNKKTSSDALRGKRKYQCTVNALESIQGAEREVVVGGPGDQKRVKVFVPAGIADGTTLKISVADEDVLVKVTISEHKYVSRNGNDIHLKLPVTVKEALNGITLEVPSPKGSVKVSIPPQKGELKRVTIEGKGLSGNSSYASDGDLHIEPFIILPDRISDVVSEASEAFDAHYSSDVRQGFIKTF